MERGKGDVGGGKSEEGVGVGQRARGSREHLRNEGKNGWCRDTRAR